MSDGSTITGYKRPYASEVIKGLNEEGIRQIVWTHGEKEYAESVVKVLFPFPVTIYSRNDCEMYYNMKKKECHVLKDLNKLYKLHKSLGPHNTIMVDNRTDIAAMNSNNHIKVEDFLPPKGKGAYNQITDLSLVNLYKHIKENKNVRDARFITGIKISTKGSIEVDE